MLNLGENLKYQREINGLSQSKLSKMTGISQQNISSWENNVYSPNIEYCVQLADFYGITVDELIGRDIPAAGKITRIEKSIINSNIKGSVNIK